MRRLGFLSLFLLLGLSLALPAAAQPVKDTVTYKISNVLDVQTRSAIAATGADIFEVGHDYVLVEATGREARALKRLGLELTKFRTQGAFVQAFPPADSAYHDYAEMVAELNQAAFDHPDIFSLFSIGLTYDGRTASTTSRPAAMSPGARTASPTPDRATSAPISTATGATSGAAAAAAAARRAATPTGERPASRLLRPRWCATSSTAA